MTLRELLTDLPGDRTVANARAWLEEPITVPNDTPVDTRGVMARLSVSDASTVFATLRAASESNALVAEGLEMLRLSGLDFSHDNMREMVDALFPAGLAERVKALGQKSIPRWRQVEGLSRLKDGCIPVAQTIVTSASGTAGYAGLDWSAITAATTTVNLSGTTVKTLTDAPSDSSGVTTLLTRLPSAITLSSGAVTVGTNNDKTGYSLSGTQTFNNTGTWTGNLSGSVGSVTAGVTITTNNDKTGYTIATGGIGTGDIDSTALNEIADAILDRIMSAGTDSGGDNTTSRTVRQALRTLRNRVNNAAGTLTVYKEDDTTASWTAATTQTAGDPISQINPT